MVEEINNWENEGGSSEPLPNLYDILANCYDSLEFKLSTEFIDLKKEEWVRLIRCKCGIEKIEEYVKEGINYYSVSVKTEGSIAIIKVRFYNENNLEPDIIESLGLMEFGKYFRSSQ